MSCSGPSKTPSRWAPKPDLLVPGNPRGALVGGIDGVSIPSARGGLRRGLVARCSLFLVTGAVWEGLILIAYGVLVIGLVDNLARPMLAGADTKMPDYVVLISTLGGLEIFGMNGIVLGPVIAAMFMVVWDIFAASRRREPTS
jgi:hypothetical protein